VLLNSQDSPYIIAGAMATNINDISTFNKVDDTFYLTYVSKLLEIDVTYTLQNYHNTARVVKTLDTKYFHIKSLAKELTKKIKIAAENIIDESITTQKLANHSITGDKLEGPNLLYDLRATEDVSIISQDLGSKYRKIRVNGYLDIKPYGDSFNGVGLQFISCTYTSPPTFNFENYPEVFGETRRLNFDLICETSNNGGTIIELAYQWEGTATDYGYTVKKIYISGQSEINCVRTSVCNGQIKFGNIKIYSLLSLEE
jgi:hypothetical protein